MKSHLLRRFIFALILLLCAATYPVSAIDYQVACDQCNAQAYADWTACWQQYDDEGDSECRLKREEALIACQVQYCIYINN